MEAVITAILSYAGRYESAALLNPIALGVVVLTSGAVAVQAGASDVLQVAYYRLTGGKRIFRMAPLHHHFEKVGWREPQVVQRFWIIGIRGAPVGTILALEV